MLIHLNLYGTNGVFRVELYDLGTWFSHLKKVYYKSEFQLVFGQSSISSWSKKGQSQAEPSQAENPSARAMAQASSGWTHH